MTYTSQHHSFDIALASKYGIEEAILIHHFLHWIRINRQAGRNIREGKCWTYQSRKEILDHFPYWNLDRVKYLCEKLVALGVLVTANFNKSPMDKTLWYAFADEKAFGVDEEYSKNLYERQNCPSKGKSAFPKGKSAPPIPDTKTNTKTTDKEEEHTPPSPLKGKSTNADSVRVSSSSSSKEEKVKFGAFVKLTQREYDEFVKEYNKPGIDSLIEEMNDYCAASRPAGYKDYAAALRQWIRRRKQEKSKVSYREAEKAAINNYQKSYTDNVEARKNSGGVRISEMIYNMKKAQKHDLRWYIVIMPDGSEWHTGDKG